MGNKNNRLKNNSQLKFRKENQKMSNVTKDELTVLIALIS